MNEIRKIVDLSASTTRVWAFLTEPEKIATWLMDCDLACQPGATFTFTAPAAGRWDGKVHCEVRDVIEFERISYTWCANDIGVVTLVTFDIEPHAGGTRLTLVHRGLEGAGGGAAGRHVAGWTRCLRALEVAVSDERPAYDWSEFQITYHVDAAIDDVFALWSTADGMKRFWGDAVSASDEGGRGRAGSETYQNGDRVRIGFSTHNETDLEILGIAHNQFVLFSFGSDYGWVRVGLEPDGKRTRIVLKQFGLPTDGACAWHVHANARGWWIANLLNIQSVLVHGHDLRVREPGCEAHLATLFSPDAKPDAATHDWTAFDVYLYVDAEPRAVMDRWRSTSGLASFFIHSMTLGDHRGVSTDSAAITAGDHYRWQWIHGHSLEGEFIAVDENRIEFTFGADYRVCVSAAPAGRGTLLRLHQSGMADEEQERIHGSLNCRSCWVYFLVNLKSVVEHGCDLRDPNPLTADAISVAYNQAAP